MSSELDQWSIAREFEYLGIPKLERLAGFRKEILRFSGAINLVSARTLLTIDSTHFADCILGGNIIFAATQCDTIYDFGSGNGFPGVVMAIVEPEREFVLVDSDERKIEFLKHVVNHLELKNVKILGTTIQSLKPASVLCAVSRGFATIPRSLIAVNRIFAIGGSYFHFKGEEWPTEVGDMPTQLFSHWEPHLVDNYVIVEEKRTLSIVETRRIR
jgi:16S rRNA (guanine527-N7)-methyltransferase